MKSWKRYLKTFLKQVMNEIKKRNFLVSKEVEENLENVIQSKLFSNGYIFYGPEGIGKKQAALNFITDIFKNYESCSNVEQKIKDNNHPDFLLIEPTYIVQGKLINQSDSELTKNKNKQTIRIDQIRNIKQFLGRKSIESEKKIILIVDAHLLNEAASNCLLKTLEEPTNGIFILLTSRINVLIDTIISRCQLVRFKPFSFKEIKNFIEENLESKDFFLKKEKDWQYLINSSNGSPLKTLENIEIWEEIPKDIRDIFEFPINDNLEILKIAKFISETLENHKQIVLINLIQYKWWGQTKEIKIIKELESLKKYINGYVQPRLAWEVTLLKIANMLVHSSV